MYRVRNIEAKTSEAYKAVLHPINPMSAAVYGDQTTDLYSKSEQTEAL